MEQPRFAISASLRQELDNTKIGTVEDLMYADLRHMGWTKQDAFYVSYHHVYGSMSITQQNRIATKIESNPYIKARIDNIRDKTMLSPDEIAKETSKEKLLSDLLLARSRTKSGSKEWIDITAKIADYAKIKQDDIKTDDQPIRYHLPVHYPRTCKDCLIYQNGKQLKE